MELQQSKPPNDMPWLICGDFNVTLLQEDRNNLNVNNWHEYIKFSDLIMDLDLINLPLRGKNYTWSNSRLNPTMVRLDRFLISPSWSVSFPNSTQEAIANTSSDHSPLLLTAETNFRKTAFFRFEMVRQRWTEMGLATTPVELGSKVKALQKVIREWANQRTSNIKE